MLATFIIGLREGLEAALIVGIIAAFLRNNGKSLTPMWLGVLLAILLSIAVGLGLEFAQHTLPQAEQEAMETVIGLVAAFFVTGMIVWMNNHARHLKWQLESEAAHALKRSSALALASMAFLAVLKEGFETCVFLIATFSAAQSAVLAAAGAILGLLAAVVTGWGIYAGGVKFNLSRFFHYTTAFLILVAAGLVMSSLRTAHEAGWIIAGQQSTTDLAWLVAPGTIQSALITGVLGIPADPRLIELIGWLAYLVPITLYVYWPRSHRPQPRAVFGIKLGVAASLIVTAGILALTYPTPRLIASDTANLSTPQHQPNDKAAFQAAEKNSPARLNVTLAPSDTISLILPNDTWQRDRHKGVAASAWTIHSTDTPTNAPKTLTLNQIAVLVGDRIPVGLNPQRHSGPFHAAWSVHRVTRVWSTHGVLLDAIGRSTAVVTLSGGGLLSPRTFTVEANNAFSPSYNWQVSSDYVERIIDRVNASTAAQSEHLLWSVHLPIALMLIALMLLFSAIKNWLALRHNHEAEKVKAENIRKTHQPHPEGASSHAAN